MIANITVNIVAIHMQFVTCCRWIGGGDDTSGGGYRIVVVVAADI